MRRSILSLFILLASLSVNAQDDRFAREGVVGCFMLYDASRDTTVRVNAHRCAQRFIPASTFKIFNSLVALQTEAIPDEYTPIPWDSVIRSNPNWNTDMNLRDAFRLSCVPCYQTLARRVGSDRMKEWIAREGYGNGEIGGGIDRFWLSGDLRISAEEQIDFLRRLHDGRLDFSSRSMIIVRDIMLMDITEDYVVRGKTGWATDVDGDRHIGWVVGWVEKGEKVTYFALNLSSQDEDIDMAQLRNRLLYGYLVEFGVVQ